MGVGEPSSYIFILTMSYDQVISGDNMGTISVWDVQTGKLEFEFRRAHQARLPHPHQLGPGFYMYIYMLCIYVYLLRTHTHTHTYIYIYIYIQTLQ